VSSVFSIDRSEFLAGGIGRSVVDCHLADEHDKVFRWHKFLGSSQGLANQP